MDKTLKDKDYEMEEKNKELKKKYNENEKVVTKITENLFTTDNELRTVKQQLMIVQTIQRDFDKEPEVCSLKKSVEDNKKKN